MAILRLKAWNIERIKDIDIEPGDTPVVVIAGENKQGKSCTLNCIKYLFEGTGAISDVPLRLGTDKGGMICETEDFIVRRNITEKGPQQVVVEMKSDGKAIKEPQAFLNKVRGKFLDPSELKRMAPKQQAETIRDLCGLDFAEHDANRAAVFDERKAANADVKRLDGVLQTMAPHDPDLPDGEVSATELLGEVERRRAVNTNNQSLRDAAESASQAVVAAREFAEGRARNVAAIEEQLAEAKAQLGRADDALVAAQNVLDDAKDAAADLTDEDVTCILSQVDEAESTNAAIRRNQSRVRAEAEHKDAKAKATALTEKLGELDRLRTKQIAEAPVPIRGLGFDESGGITFNGLPFPDQASDAEEALVWSAIGIALNPELKVLLMRHGSDLNQASRKQLWDMMLAKGYQVWLEVVGEDDDATVVIEDGRVRDDGTEEADKSLF